LIATLVVKLELSDVVIDIETPDRRRALPGQAHQYGNGKQESLIDLWKLIFPG
jgi:hypothetical protein